MSSFTDSPILNFNPYIQQAPVDDYLRVGMMKQQQYNQGVEEVQQVASNTAGLDIIQKAQKDHLQGLMDNTGQELKKYAGSDYSDQQLVNSLTGMIHKVAKDPYVQTGVASTINYRKGLSDMDAAQKAGKSSISNEYDFMNGPQGASRWLNGGLNDSFDGKFTPYTDVQKKWLDIADKLKVSGNTTDNPFVVDGQGKIVMDYDPKGNLIGPKISGMMTETGKTGIPKEKIENAIRTSMSPDDLNQMGIDARYTFRNYTPNDLAAESAKKYDSMRAEGNAQIANLQKYAKMNSANPAEYTKTMNSIKFIQEQIGDGGSLQQQQQQEMDWIRKNPDDAKVLIYKEATIKGFSDAHSSEISVSKYMENPGMKQLNWEKEWGMTQAKFRLDQAKFKDQVRHEDVDEKQGWARIDVEKQNSETSRLGYELKLKEYTGGQAPFTTFTGLNPDVKTPLESMTSDLSVHTETANNLTNQIAKSLGVAPGIAEAQINAYQQETDKTKSKMSPQLRATADRIIDERNAAKAIDDAMSKARTEALNSPEIIAQNKDLEKQLNSLQGVTVGTVHYSPREVYEMITKAKEGNIGSTGAPIYSLGTNPGIDESKLSGKQKVLYQAIASNQDAGLSGLFNKYGQIAENTKNQSSQLNTIINKKLAEKHSEWVPQITSEMVPTEAQRTWYEGAVGAMLSAKNVDKGSNVGLDKKVLNDWMQDPNAKKKLQYHIIKEGESRTLLVKNGNEEQRITLNPEEAAQLPNGAISPNADIIMRLSLGGGNTNVIGDEKGSYFQKHHFTNIKNLNVTGDFQQELGDPSKVYPILNLKTASGWKTIQSPYPMDITNARTAINTIDDTYIKEYFLKNGPKEWAKDIQDLK